MGKYTVYGSKVDEYIQKNYLNKIVDNFVKDANPISIILFGGFGKGEGSIQFVNGKPIPFNDFDLYVITKKKLSDKELDEMSANAARSMGMGGLEIACYPDEGYHSKKFFHVDVRCIPYNQLGKLMNTQRYYELKYGSQVIYGDKAVLNKIKEISPRNISLSEGLRNLFNKIHTMLLGLRKSYTNDQKKALIFWSYKCYISICEALLILDKKFAPSSLERSKLFKKIYKKDFPDLYKLIPDLAEKVEKATNFKVRLNFDVDKDRLWKNAFNDISIVFEYYLHKWLGNNSIEYIINKKLPFIYFKPYLKEKFWLNLFFLQYGLNLVYFNILRKNDKLYFRPLLNWKDVGLRLILPIYHLLKSRQDESYLDMAYNELKKFIKVNRKEFWHLRERALKAYGLYYEQRLL